jgi:hypothetical protein
VHPGTSDLKLVHPELRRADPDRDRSADGTAFSAVRRAPPNTTRFVDEAPAAARAVYRVRAINVRDSP